MPRRISHDGSVNRTMNGKGDMAEMTFDEIRGAGRGRRREGANVR